MDTVFILIAVIADIIAAVMMVFLLKKSEDYCGKKGKEGRYFRYLILTVIGMAAIDAAMVLAPGFGTQSIAGVLRRSSDADVKEVVLNTALNMVNLFMTTVFFFTWFVYVNWRLYHNRDYARRRFWFGVSPLLISGAMTLTGMGLILFFANKGVLILILASLLVFLGIRIFYFIASVILVNIYKKQNGYMKFFDVKGFFIPVIAGALIQDFTPLYLRALGAAIGVMFLYASISREMRYQDTETGLYNSSYKEYLGELVRQGEFSPCSAMVFRTEGAGGITELSAALKEQLPKDCEPIRHSENEVVVLTSVREKAPLLLVTEDIKEMAQVEASCVMKKKNETPEEFMRRVL